MKNVTALSTLSIEEINQILDDAEKFEQGQSWDGAKDKIAVNLFFENSTRTHYSFQTAQHRLDMKVMNFTPETSSVKKGETFYDTIKTFDALGVDLFVIRHGENEYYKQLIGKLNAPILSGGDGTANHPSQSLLDIYTIKQQFKKFEGLNVAIIGDIKHSRVAHTNIETMKRLGMNVVTSGPKDFSEPEYEFMSVDEAIKWADVVMLLRVQHERHENLSKLSIKEYHEQFGLTVAKMQAMKPNAIIMHPAPFNRNVEIADEVVECEKSRIFKQMENGVYIRQALIKYALS